MKRVFVCLIILCAIILQAVFSIKVLKDSNDELFKIIDEAVYFKRSEEKEKAIEKIEELSAFWEKYYVRTSFIIQSSKLEDISFSVAKLMSLLMNESDEFYSECEVIKLAAKIIYDSEFPSLHSVL